MAGAQPIESQDDMTLAEAGARLAEARRAWAESFLRFKMGRPPAGQKVVTDNQAKAMADVEVNVTQAEVDWELAKRRHDAAEPRS
jgi:hypothetical protein